MKLTLSKKCASLSPFEANLPTFTLVTGLNGSGKSQLLSGISSGSIFNDVSPVPSDRFGSPAPEYRTPIALFTAESFSGHLSQRGTDDFNGLARRERIGRKVALTFKQIREEWVAWGRSRGLDTDELKKITIRAHYHSREKSVIARHPVIEGPETEILLLLSDLQAKAVPKETIEPNTGPDFGNGLIGNAEGRLGLPYFLLSEEDITHKALDPTPFFRSSIGPLFTRYRNLQLLNLMRRLQQEEGEETELPLTPDAFNERYGPAPWKVVNDTLRQLGVDATIASPSPTEFDEYIPVMTTQDGAVFPPDAMSTGERVILNLALCGYQVGNTSENIEPSKLVLLDEVDAPLHPAMVKIYLDIIDTVLVRHFHMHVIATTHSPSTVALFPGDTVYVMKKGVSGPQPVAKSEAIADLVSGVPTLSVALEDRRQVFAESPVEANNLDQLYQILRPTLKSPISLQFIATGSKHDNSSRDNVQRIVRSLVDAGNKTAFGLIDWDLKNIPTDRVKVLAPGRRYALENLILDPLIIALAIYRKHPDVTDYYGFDESTSFTDLWRLDPTICQSTADKVTERVLGSAPEKCVECRYCGGLTLQIDDRYLRMNAHKLESDVARAFPVFDSLTRGGSGKLTNHMIELILRELPAVVPLEVSEAFLSLIHAR
ncbi:hypothetical protein PDO_1868 [Rhizobium sp. PDO1-076]|uniref:AAA family ATPase n=1 Tax=Rhizobium sp. PDO1-076 TaxID=1125979 RepID=UPI00024E3434|nr:AAA family ATPase [Rhizobium sp. PDO1-076]EHS51477.1 hypothetical protein PDO_1868 [Rhizobium sp. PDO1-076]